MPMNYRLTHSDSPSTRVTLLPVTFLLVAALAAPSLSDGADKKVDLAPRDAKESAVAQGEYLTTNQGVRVAEDDNSLKGGARGPTLLEDFHLREKITHFDHERMPERVVHPRGSGAHGFFQVYKPLTRYSQAAVFSDPSIKTPVFVRFSLVNGNLGTADTTRDARGFATKFYTTEGVWDLVGNNIPVFFIQDAIKFPDLVHAFKPEPNNDMPQASTAHNNFWDFISLTPESMHMVMWIMSDRALPRSYRMMDGFGVHTFRLVNAEGKSTFVKFHWKPVLGVHSLVWDEAQQLAGKEPDFHRRDLWDAIDSKAYPEYELALQLVPEEDGDKLGFDLLDPTKLWPEDQIPLQRVGKLTLNRNPDNFFAETEQIAFHPGHVVPGIDMSDDPLLQGRLFSYSDTQLNRFGTPNFAQLPINQPKSPVNNFQQDGPMRFANRPGPTNYAPNSLAGTPQEAPAKKEGYVHYPAPVNGVKTRERSKTFGDHYTQAALFYNSLTPPEQEHIGQALTVELSKVTDAKIKTLMLEHLAKIDHDLAGQVAAKIGMQAPKGASATRAGKSKGLSQEEGPKDSIKSRKVAILAADGVTAADVKRMAASLKKEGATTEVIAMRLGELKGDVKVDKSFATADSVLYDAVYVPGGPESVTALRGEEKARRFVRQAYDHGKALAASGEGTDLFQSVGVGEAPGVVMEKGGSDGIKSFIAAIAQHRHWNRPQ